MRVDPASFVPYIQSRVDAMDEQGVIRIDGRVMETQEGKTPFLEAISFLKSKAAEKGCGAVDAAPGLVLAARDNALDQGKQEAPGSTGSDGSSPLVRMNRYGLATDGTAEVLALGEQEPADILLRLLVSDGIESRADRIEVCNPEYRFVGIAVGPHPGTFGQLCVMDFSGGYQNKSRKEQQDIHERHHADA